MKERRALGRHLLMDFYGCDAALLDDAPYLEEQLRAAAAAAGALVVDARFHRFAPQGVTGVLVLRESHLAIHTWPERGFAAVDLFTCGALDPRRACPLLARALGARHHTVRAHERGARH